MDNRYRPPAAQVADIEQTSGPARRPALVWVISIFVFFSAAITLWSIYMVYAGGVTLPPATAAYLESISGMEVLLSVLIGALNIAAAVSLFRLRKAALYLFIGALVLNALSTAWNLMFRNYLAVVGGKPFGIFFALVTALGIAAYAWRLRKKGILR